MAKFNVEFEATITVTIRGRTLISARNESAAKDRFSDKSGAIHEAVEEMLHLEARDCANSKRLKIEVDEIEASKYDIDYTNIEEYED